ncbi:MAG: hypothetical protein KIT09_08615 [Bryobacteraceae bacterium]|nr:hypothetical protein [Bryobacteraceae bacterium]
MLLAAIAATAWAQSPVDPEKTAGQAWILTFERDLTETGGGGELACRVDRVAPGLDLSLRYRAGYYAALPTSQFPPAPTSFSVGMRVTPADGSGAYYFAQLAYVPAAPRGPDIVMNFSGGFEPGEGAYRVDWLLRDERGRRCRKSWEFKLAVDVATASIVAPPAPGTVRRLMREAPPFRGSRQPYRVAIVLNVSPLSPTAARLSEKEQDALLATLNTLFEAAPFEAVLLSVVSLPKRREVYRSERPVAESRADLAREMAKLEFATVALNSLRRPHNHVYLLADAMQAAAGNADPDAVVVISHNTGETGRIPQRLVEQVSGRRPMLFYLQLNDYGSDLLPDTIEKFTKAAGGRVFEIYKPKHLALALRNMVEALERSKAAHVAIGPGRPAGGL